MYQCPELFEGEIVPFLGFVHELISVAEIVVGIIFVLPPVPTSTTDGLLDGGRWIGWLGLLCFRVSCCLRWVGGGGASGLLWDFPCCVCVFGLSL